MARIKKHVITVNQENQNIRFIPYVKKHYNPALNYDLLHVFKTICAPVRDIPVQSGKVKDGRS